jgi:hypothetical protein
MVSEKFNQFKSAYTRADMVAQVLHMRAGTMEGYPPDEWPELAIWFNDSMYPSSHSFALGEVYSELLKELVDYVKSHEPNPEKIKCLLDFDVEIQKLFNLFYTSNSENGALIRHRHFTFRNESIEEQYLGNIYGEDKIQAFYKTLKSFLELLDQKCKQLLEVVRSNGLAVLITEDRPEVPQVEDQKLKVNISQGHICSLYRIIEESKLMDEPTKERVFKFIKQHFEFKREQNTDSTDYCRKIFDAPPEKHLSYWSIKFQNIQEGIKAVKNKTGK